MRGQVPRAPRLPSQFVAEGLTVLNIVAPRHAIAQRIAAISAGRYRHAVLAPGIAGTYIPSKA